jgi:ABC-type polysaccharide/polyol phosphate transport system ATPase subunit
MSAKEIIRLEDIGLKLKVINSGSRSIKHFLISSVKFGSFQGKNVNILQDISFAINSGESIGIIGKNGSGKSSLLRLISGIYQPTSGSIIGKPSCMPLIELDGAFNGELTVLENISLLRVLLGIEKSDLARLVSSVIETSGLEEFKNYPMRMLSTGMKARFAFALATSVERDLLLIDESLSVGDLEFAKKAKLKVESLQKNGISLVLVSHDLELISDFTKKCLWLEDGRVRSFGNTKRIINSYRATLK